MIRRLVLFVLACSGLIAAASIRSAYGQVYGDPAKTDDDFIFQGEYVGLPREGGRKMAIQVIALGDGRFKAAGYRGGLPGEGWDGDEVGYTNGKRDGKTITFRHEKDSDKMTAVLEKNVIRISGPDRTEVIALSKVERKSPTLGEKPPKGAVVLFAGKEDADKWIGADGKPVRVTDDGLLMEGANSKNQFQDCTLHVEFRLPYMPKATGQGRGNSGVYLQGRYEVQILDSFGLSGEHNECGGIYSVRKPDFNMCFPPLAWQTYDIDFRAVKFDDRGKKISNARMTIKHNGVAIHKDVEIPRTTTAAPHREGPSPGFIHLQNHGNPVRFRNIWVAAK